MDYFRVKVSGSVFSFSGVQNKLLEYYNKTNDPAATAGYCLRSLGRSVGEGTCHAVGSSPRYSAVFSGGVASNSMLRKHAPAKDCVFCPPEYSTDNAMGIAVLAWLQGGAVWNEPS